MIRIDEIYQNTFLPWVRKNLPHTRVCYHEPFGHSDPDSIVTHTTKIYADRNFIDLLFNIRHPVREEKSFVYFFDQEPLILDFHQLTFDKVDDLNTYYVEGYYYYYCYC